MATAPYIGSALPAKIIVTDGVTNLFRYAEIELGDHLQWWRIAELNGLSDPWVGAVVSLKIPKRASNGHDGLPYA